MPLHGLTAIFLVVLNVLILMVYYPHHEILTSQSCRAVFLDRSYFCVL